MTEHSRTHTALRNSVYRLLGYFLPIIFSIAVTPVIVNTLGIKSYGLMVFVNSLFAILGLLDMGISTSTIKHIAEYRGRNDDDGIVRSVRTANSLFLLIALAGSLLVVGLLAIAMVFFPEKIGNNPELFWIVAFATGTFVVNALNSTYAILPSAYERFDVSTKINAASLTFASLGSLVTVLLGGTLPEVFAVQFGLACLFTLVWRASSLRIFPRATYALGWSRDELRRTVAFGGYASVNELAKTSLFSLDRLIIPLYLGAAQLTYYTIPGNLTARIPGISDTISGVLFPLSANLNASGDTERLQKVYVRSTRLMLLISASVTTAIALNGTEILRYWINADVASNAGTAIIILALTNFVLSILSPVASFFMTLNKWKFYTSVSIGMAVVNVAALFALVPTYGINGAAVAYLISTLPIFYATHRLETRYLGIQGSVRRWVVLLAKAGVAALAFALVNYFAIKPFITSLPSLIVLGPLSVLVYMAIYFLFGFVPREDRDDVYSFVRKQIPSWKKR